jgi:hypothetical protein
VLFWLERRCIKADEDLIDRIFRRAKASRTVLTEDEVLRECRTSGKVEKVEKVEEVEVGKWRKSGSTPE